MPNKTEIETVCKFLWDKTLLDPIATCLTVVEDYVYGKRVDLNESAWDVVKGHYDFLKSRM